MRIVFSRLAERDLEEIGDYIARDNPRRALSFIVELRAHCRRLAETPRAFPARSDLRAGLRYSLYGRYLIFFLPSAEDILIVRVLHGARDLPAVFESGNE